MVDKEVWIKLQNETLSSEKEIHLLKNNYEPQHPWSIMLKNILHGRNFEIWNVANSYEEGMIRVQEHLREAIRLGYVIEEKRIA